MINGQTTYAIPTELLINIVINQTNLPLHLNGKLINDNNDKVIAKARIEHARLYDVLTVTINGRNEEIAHYLNRDTWSVIDEVFDDFAGWIDYKQNA